MLSHLLYKRKLLALPGLRFDCDCISGDTEVLTDAGWKFVVHVTLSDRLWDGFHWVTHDGVIAKGRSTIIDFGGIGITPDHLVQTKLGVWQEASSASHDTACSLVDALGGVPKARGSSKRPSGVLPPGESAKNRAVFDILNAGKNHCFTVRGRDGRPFIIHNCACAAPAPPDYSGVAAANEKAAKYAYDTAERRLSWDKEQFAEASPYIKRLRDLSLRMGEKSADVADANQVRADQQWEQQQQTFKPIEQQMALESMGIKNLSADDQAELASLMGPGSEGMDPTKKALRINDLVTRANDAAADKAMTRAGAEANNVTGQVVRGMARMGGDPAKLEAAGTQFVNNQTAAKVGAATAARNVADAQGVTQRASAANFGRGMPATAAGAYGLTIGAGNAAVGQTQTAANAALPNAQLVDGGFASGMQAAGLGSQAALGYGNMLTNAYGQQLNAWGTQMQAQNQSDAGMGQMLGMVGGLAAKYAFSSKYLKRNPRTVDGESAVEAIERMPVDSWEYKEGVADGGRHIGPYAEDVQREFGDQAAPGGKVIDLVSMNGISLAAIKELARRVDALDGGYGLKRSA